MIHPQAVRRSPQSTPLTHLSAHAMTTRLGFGHVRALEMYSASFKRTAQHWPRGAPQTDGRTPAHLTSLACISLFPPPAAPGAAVFLWFGQSDGFRFRRYGTSARVCLSLVWLMSHSAVASRLDCRAPDGRRFLVFWAQQCPSVCVSFLRPRPTNTQAASTLGPRE